MGATAESYGVEYSKKALKAMAEIAMKIEAKNEDGKVTFMEAVTVAIAKFTDIVAVIKNATYLRGEYLDYTDEEREEVVEYLKTELDLENDVVEVLIEKTFAVALSMADLIESYWEVIKAKKEATE